MEQQLARSYLPLLPQNLGFPAVTDHKCGVNLRAISMFCTGLLTIFLNSEVTGLAGLPFTVEIIWDCPRVTIMAG